MERVTLIPKCEIDRRVAELAAELAVDIHHLDPNEIVLLFVLKGAMSFGVNLAEQLYLLGFDLEQEMLTASSYSNGTVSSRLPKINFHFEPEKIRGKHVIVVEDMTDTNRTMNALLQLLFSAQVGVASATVVCLLEKVGAAEVETDVHHVGFRIPPYWVDGKSVDTGGKGRGNPNLARVITASQIRWI